MEGNPGSPLKVHYISTQFVGGTHYISCNSILPFCQESDIGAPLPEPEKQFQAS
jgi:hypothetical protein